MIDSLFYHEKILITQNELWWVFHCYFLLFIEIKVTRLTTFLSGNFYLGFNLEYIVCQLWSNPKLRNKSRLYFPDKISQFL